MIVRQFNTPKDHADVALEAAEKAMLEIVNEADLEDTAAGSELGDKDIDNDNVPDDKDAWFNERQLLTPEELEELNVSVKPMHLILVKVRLIFYIDGPCLLAHVDTEARLCPYPLIHDTPSTMEGDTETDGAERAVNAARCENSLELNLRYVEVRS
jgi:hypothetical protein